MNLEEFATLSKLSKTNIIVNRLCKRFIHRGNWQQRVLEEIIVDIEKDIAGIYSQYVDDKIIEDDTNMQYGIHN